MPVERKAVPGVRGPASSGDASPGAVRLATGATVTLLRLAADGNRPPVLAAIPFEPGSVCPVPDVEERMPVATGRYIGEGFDDARLDTLFLAMPVAWRGTLARYVERLHRLHPAKREVLVYDYVDEHGPHAPPAGGWHPHLDARAGPIHGQRLYTRGNRRYVLETRLGRS